MERVSEKPKNRIPYIILVLMLVIAVLGTVLFLAHGMDTDRFFVSVSAPTCLLVLSLSFPIYIFIEFMSLMVNNGENYAAFPLAGEKHDRNVKITAAVALIGLVVALSGYFVFRDSNPQLALTLESMSFAPGFILYVGLALYDALDREAPTKTIVILMVYFFAMGLLETLAIILIYQKSIDWSMLFVGAPILSLCLALVGFEE